LRKGEGKKKSFKGRGWLWAGGRTKMVKKKRWAYNAEKKIWKRSHQLKEGTKGKKEGKKPMFLAPNEIRQG